MKRKSRDEIRKSEMGIQTEDFITFRDVNNKPILAHTIK